MDPRTYIRLHDGMPDHPKVVGLSDAAFRLYVESLCWCSRHLTDGAVPLAAMRRMGGWSKASSKELADAGLLEPGVTDSGWMLHDYTEHQRTAGAVAGIRAAKQQASALANHERWHVRRSRHDPSCELCAIPNGSHVGSEADPTRISGPDPKTSPETETETDKEQVQNPRRPPASLIAKPGTDDDPDFAAFWAAYPRKDDKGSARKAWRTATATRHVEPKDIIAGAERYAADCTNNGTTKKFIKLPASWLNAESYNNHHQAAGPAYPEDVWNDDWPA